MKYTYAYKTSDGQRHEATMMASSRDEVFMSLRKQGIKPIKVVAADGSKANGEVRGVRKRMVALITVAVALAAGIVAFCVATNLRDSTDPSTDRGKSLPASPLARQVISGDRARLAEARTQLFTNAAERLLVRFAEPGQTNEAVVVEKPTEADFAAFLSRPVQIWRDEHTEVVDLKRILEGMRQELRDYLRGGGTTAAYVDELVKRQALEHSYRIKAETKLAELLSDSKSAYEYWLKANAQLQSMGIATLPLPIELRTYQLSIEID